MHINEGRSIWFKLGMGEYHFLESNRKSDNFLKYYEHQIKYEYFIIASNISFFYQIFFRKTQKLPKPTPPCFKVNSLVFMFSAFFQQLNKVRFFLQVPQQAKGFRLYQKVLKEKKNCDLQKLAKFQKNYPILRQMPNFALSREKPRFVWHF